MDSGDSKKLDIPASKASTSPPESNALDSHSPDHSPTSPSPPADDMALVAHNNPTSLLGGGVNAGINKRYRPAPAKTFQCRGYGECRMVFSRSEHLARHIRKHTGERPFTCHCGKQFSRLDNLRQHAQTVHADKADQNEQMMRDLTSLHATMAAATKSVPRNKRSQANNGENGVKQEDMGDSFRGRPGTSTGYEGDHNGIYQGYDGHPRPDNRHSFRDHSQSFLAPSSSTSSAQSQSFLGFSNTFNFISGDGSSNSRPPTGDALARTLPPLAAVVSRALPSSSSGPFPIAPTSTQHILPVPGSVAFRRPSTATRPGTAPASSYYSAKPAYAGGNGLAAISVPGHAGRMASGYDGGEPTSPTGVGAYESPFSFHPPSVADPSHSSPATASSSSPPPVNPRKRPYPGSDGDDAPSAAPRNREPADYEYGTESRPQSRRLSVMELCNDPDADAGSRAVLSGHPGSSSRPTTSSGITASASALALVDRASRLLSPELFSGATSSAAGADAKPATGYGSSQAFGGGGVYSESRRDFSTAATSSSLFPALRGQYPSSPVSDASSSPRSSAASPFATRAGGLPSPDASGTLSVRRGGAESHVSSPQSPAAVGMRV